MMEILFVTRQYPPFVGGMEKQSYELINGVAKSHKVHRLIYDGRKSRLRFLLTAPLKARKILAENPNISLVHFNDGLMALFGLRIKKTTSIPLLATFHGLDVVFPSRFFQKFVINKFKKLDGVIAVSLFTAQECIDRGIDPDKVHVVRNGVDTGLSLVDTQPGFREILGKKLGIPLNEKKILVSVGRCIPRKGFAWFMTRVLPALEKNIIYLIVGPTNRNIRWIKWALGLMPRRLSRLIVLGLGLGIDEIEVRKALRRPEIVDRVFHIGQQSIEDLVQIIKHADLFVMPNVKVPGDAEGFGLVALEAAAIGTPVLASDTEGIPSAVIPGENGFLAPPGDESRWIDQIQGLLLDLDHLRRFGVQAQQYTVAHFTWEKMVESYISLFKKYNFRQAPDGEKAI